MSAPFVPLVPVPTPATPTNLVQAIKQSSPENLKVIQAMIAGGADVNQRDVATGQTPLTSIRSSYLSLGQESKENSWDDQDQDEAPLKKQRLEGEEKDGSASSVSTKWGEQKGKDGAEKKGSYLKNPKVESQSNFIAANKSHDVNTL
jgi:hypothetical protein